jgi:hypothetical protein
MTGFVLVERKVEGSVEAFHNTLLQFNGAP